MSAGRFELSLGEPERTLSLLAPPCIRSPLLPRLVFIPPLLSCSLIASDYFLPSSRAKLSKQSESSGEERKGFLFEEGVLFRRVSCHVRVLGNFWKKRDLLLT